MKVRIRFLVALAASAALSLAVACTSLDTGTKYDGTGITSGYGAGGHITPKTNTHDTEPAPSSATTTGTTKT